MSQDRNTFFEGLRVSNHLPSLPHILLRIIEACNREDSDFKELTDIIEKDPALTANILQMINSSYFSLPNKVISLGQAVVLIGMDAVKNVALSTSIHQVFDQSRDWQAFNLKQIWRHSLKCALMGRSLATRIKYTDPDEAFLTGMIHDIGKLVMWVHFKKDYEKIVKAVKLDTERLLSEEVKLGAAHSEVGAWTVGQWHLPSLISDAILYHHEPLYRIVDALPLVKIIYIANILSHNDEEHDKGMEAANSILGIPKEEMESLIADVEKALKEAARYMDIDIESAEEEKRRDDQRKKQQLLSREIGHASMLLGTLQSMIKATDDEGLIRIMYQSLKILLGIKESLFFQYDYERDLLLGKADPRGPRPPHSTLAIPFNESECLPVRSLKESSILDSFREDGLSILDEQLIRIMERDGIVCFPLFVDHSKVGVLVLGVTKNSLAQILKFRRRIGLLTGHMALALHADNVRKIQRRQIQTERIEASSDAVKQIVHEANNPLGIIRNYIAIMEKKLGKESEVGDETRIIKEEIDRVSTLLAELAEVSEPGAKREAFDINAAISDLITVSRETLLQGITVNTELTKPLPKLLGDGNKVKQIILNLIKNAVEAMSEGGNLKITSELLDSFPLNEIPEISIDRGEETRFIKVTVTDNGTGIPETIRMHLFEPFVSTKREGHQGIGLSVVYNTVKAMRGTITVRSNRGEGTRFNLYFPLGE